MTLGKRLQHVLRKLELTQTGLSKAIDISNVVINRYIKDKTTPDYNFLNKIAAAYKININWLITGNGTMFNSPNFKDIGERQYYNMPIISGISCGTPEEIEAIEPEDHILIDTLSLSGDFNNYFAFYASGDSMHPYISNGDVVVIRQHHNWDSVDNRICAIRVDGEVTLKKVTTFAEGHKVLLSPFNKEFSPLLLEEEKLENAYLIGIATMAVRNL